MARDDNKKTILEGQAAINLWLEGVDVWNQWVADNPVADISFEDADFRQYDKVSFERYMFPKGHVNFSRAQFGKGDVYFDRARFGEGDVDFSSAQFGEGDISFEGAQFGNGSAYFFSAQFGPGNTDFSRAQFSKGIVNFDFAQFGEGDVNFFSTQFGEGDAYFYNTLFSRGNVYFYCAQFGEGNVSFEGAQFGQGFVNFYGTQFGTGDVYFDGVQFEQGDVSFYGTQFGEGTIGFSNVQFGEGDVSLASAKILGRLEFSNLVKVHKISGLSFKFTTFEGPVDMDGNEFHCIPDFTNTKLSHQLSLSHFSVKPKMRNKGKLFVKTLIGLRQIWLGSQLRFSSTKKAIKLSRIMAKKFPWLAQATAADRQDIDRLRRLKELAESNKHHKLALDLHIEEMKCSRWIETPWHQLFTEFLFQKLGNYGRSILRPILSLILLWLVCAPIYAVASNNKEISSDALIFSFSQMFSIIPSSKDARTESSQALYGTLIDGKLVVDVPHMVFAVAGVQSLASVALVFLIGLALRNRFRI
ncbi:pentapeptide repeat-containing protein [Pseudoalteromonas luteoviolacea]|uniref:pentapeptide repeat-containing protein n=1 Tax=Pseudoalteromonas luteoviolacea TaxID=43657 RepID=UPI001B375246|nr:pentapeptide repeat-containing protein [Pseudoalteromonas luteoviolacea]MBQ4837130.1 hypothetical protein [Pseudoalteromonas luteoviolacea]